MSGHESSGTQSSQEIFLHHETREIPTDKPLMSLEESLRQQGVNAAVLAEFILPTMNSSEQPKKVHLLDFGEDIPEEGKALFVWSDGDSRHIASSRSRFALHGANYHPDTHLIGFYKLPIGRTTVGREATSHPSYLLGLSDTIPDSQKNEANKMLSRRQFTIEVTDQGRIMFEDHSTNGTEVRFAQ
jgi:hypothetical protein